MTADNTRPLPSDHTRNVLDALHAAEQDLSEALPEVVVMIHGDGDDEAARGVAQALSSVRTPSREIEAVQDGLRQVI